MGCALRRGGAFQSAAWLSGTQWLPRTTLRLLEARGADGEYEDKAVRRLIFSDLDVLPLRPYSLLLDELQFIDFRLFYEPNVLWHNTHGPINRAFTYCATAIRRGCCYPSGSRTSQHTQRSCTEKRGGGWDLDRRSRPRKEALSNRQPAPSLARVMGARGGRVRFAVGRLPHAWWPSSPGAGWAFWKAPSCGRDQSINRPPCMLH